MSLEIERKFIVNELFPMFPKFNWGNSIYYSDRNITQGYFSDGVTRVRIVSQGLYEEDERAYLTIKSERVGSMRHEFEYQIPIEDAHQMLDLFCKHKIEKTRYKFKELNNNWEVDVFKGDNEGLILAEIELKSEDEEFELPCFIGKEVTKDKRYYNSNLAKNPFKKWKKLYTSYFNSTTFDYQNAVSIAGKPPAYYNGREFKKLAPKYWFFQRYKKDKDKEFYTEQYYKEVLNKLNPEEVYNELGQNAVLLCWEKPGEFCHRHIVAEWLTKALDIEIREIGEELNE